jgi:hypothetical protein
VYSARFLFGILAQRRRASFAAIAERSFGETDFQRALIIAIALARVNFLGILGFLKPVVLLNGHNTTTLKNLYLCAYDFS